jgi:hypothetical protein
MTKTSTLISKPKIEKVIKQSICTRSQRSAKEGVEKVKKAHRINSRAKGSAGEREFAGKISELLNVQLVRKLDQTRGGGHDLELAKNQNGPLVDAVGRFAFECKRYGVVTEGKIGEWWKQAVEQAEKAELIPALAYRENHGSWKIVLPLNTLCPTIPFRPEVWATTELPVEAFALFVREQLVGQYLNL